MKRIDIAFLIGVAASIILTSFTGFAQQCATVRDTTLRLHILANSDSEEDQRLKLMVRDAVLTETGDVFGAATDRQAAKSGAQDNLALIEQTARRVLSENGCDFPVRAQVVNMYFTTREYDGVLMPAGNYDAVRVEIGTGGGANWWCVMFPPMCVPAAQPKDERANADERMKDIAELNEAPDYVPKFAVVELVEKIKAKIEAGK